MNGHDVWSRGGAHGIAPPGLRLRRNPRQRTRVGSPVDLATRRIRHVGRALDPGPAPGPPKEFGAARSREGLALLRAGSREIVDDSIVCRASSRAAATAASNHGCRARDSAGRILVDGGNRREDRESAAVPDAEEYGCDLRFADRAMTAPRTTRRSRDRGEPRLHGSCDGRGSSSTPPYDRWVR